MTLCSWRARNWALPVPAWSSTLGDRDANLCASAYETLCRMDDSGADHFQQIVYAHVLILQGNYREALEICESGGVSRMNHGIGQIAHFGALSGKTLALLRMGHLGEVLRITQAGRESVEENLSRSWALDFREAWLRMMAFDFQGARRICDAICENRPEYLAGQPGTISRIAAGYRARPAGIRAGNRKFQACVRFGDNNKILPPLGLANDGPIGNRQLLAAVWNIRAPTSQRTFSSSPRFPPPIPICRPLPGS